MQEPILTVSGLTKSYWNDGSKIDVLNNINISISAGEIVAIMGPSGIGKSTLLNIIGTLDNPDSGEVLYHNVNPFHYSDQELAKFRNSKIGFVFQFHHLLPEFTALENVLIPTMVYQKKNPELEDRARRMLDLVGLSHRSSHRPAAMSGGERQRVAIARALINSPDVVLADEPSGNLDMGNSSKLIDLILKLNDEEKRTFVIATHNQDIANRMHRTIFLTPEGVENP